MTVLALAVAGCASTLEPGQLERRVLGQGRPVVVLQSGLGDGQGVWAAVQAGLPKDWTSMAFSRAGYGQSPAREGEHSPCAAARELREQLQRAGLAPPYLLVGHSLGGLYQLAFSRLYPTEVSGLVLLDPTHPQHWTRLQQDAPGVALFVRAARLSPAFSAAMRREFDDQQVCLDQLAALAPAPVPTRVLVRARFVPPETGAFERLSRELWLEWPKWLPVQAVEPVDGSGHYLQRDQPAAVIRAIQAVASRGL